MLSIYDLERALSEQQDENIKMFNVLEEKENSSLRAQYETGVERARNLEAALSLAKINDSRAAGEVIPFRQLPMNLNRVFCNYTKRDGTRCAAYLKKGETYCMYHQKHSKDKE